MYNFTFDPNSPQILCLWLRAQWGGGRYKCPVLGRYLPPQWASRRASGQELRLRTLERRAVRGHDLTSGRELQRLASWRLPEVIFRVWDPEPSQLCWPWGSKPHGVLMSEMLTIVQCCTLKMSKAPTKQLEKICSKICDTFHEKFSDKSLFSDVSFQNKGSCS